MPRLSIAFAAFTLSAGLSLASGVLLSSWVTSLARAQGYSCRGYPPATVTAQISARVEALRRLEREAADRIVGLDTRPYDWLLEQAKAAEAAIAVPALLAAEAVLHACRNFIQPIRNKCAIGAGGLVRVLSELLTGDATAEAKMAYAQSMPPCERMLNIKPIDTALRMFQ
jgi:hypothetical protein